MWNSGAGVVGDVLDPHGDDDDNYVMSFLDVAFDRHWAIFYTNRSLRKSFDTEGGTFFRSNCIQLVRCDYIFGNALVQVSRSTCEVVRDFGMCTRGRGHFHIRTIASSTSGTRDGINKRRCCKYDRIVVTKFDRSTEPEDVHT